MENDRNSQKLLYEKYSPAMLGHCMRFANIKDEAEDIMIEGFMNIFKSLESFRGDCSLAFWMKRVMTNTAISYYRRHAKHYNHYSIDEHAYFDPEDTTIYINEKQSKDELLQLIQEMPEKFRIVLNLKAFEGMKYDEIAQQLDIQNVTARTRFSKAKKWLEERLISNQEK
ncbi:MAG: sigma-70 family RNA polymerase sigma factor [Bacteroidales bacterium]|nr:sigma-70 family RNA polymerase sigma factor [Bacteroidales bacterium]